jgi:negative regulator of flagellin synthesis FlgM
MKINEYVNQAQPKVYTGETKGAKDAADKAKNGQNPEQATGDKVLLSGKSKEIGRIQEAAKAAPEERAERVAAIKRQIENGTYNVDGRKVADALIKHQMGFISDKI